MPYPGVKPIFEVTFATAEAPDVPVDPDTVTFKWRVVATGVETSYVHGVDTDHVAKVSTGVYTFSPPTVTSSGPHFGRAIGVGTIGHAEEWLYEVDPSNFNSP